MSLEGIKILIDGYNLGLNKGTGVKRYANTLLNTLKSMGANTSILFSARASKNPIMSEVLFFESPHDSTKSENFGTVKILTGLIKSSVRTSLSISQKANNVNIGNVVVKNSNWQEMILDSNIITARDCYTNAIATFQLMGKESKIRVPGKIDVFHATYPLPIRVNGAAKITTIHDLIPLRLPFTTLDDKNYFYKIINTSLMDSEIIITPSESTKNDIIDIFHAKPEKIYVTYEPVSVKPVDESDMISVDHNLQKFGLERGNYILFVGAIEPKKNVGRLIDAYSLLTSNIPLVIAGKKAWLSEEELSSRNLKNVRLLGYVTDEDLRYLYTGARCFVFPSLYEGFGLPALEAMTYGCPVIVSNKSSLPEVCGDAALYVDPYDTKDISAKLWTILGDDNLRKQLSERGKARGLQFSSDNYKEKLQNVYATTI
jgi:glycosyltransferase involved in cell wall biosynthesis